MKVEAPVATRTKRRSEPGQLVLFEQRGGKRRGAGRPPKGKRAGSPHKEQPSLHARYPVHVVLRVVGAVGNLRRRCVYQAIREATLTTALREDFRTVQLSIQRTHVHLLVEANDKAKHLDAGSSAASTEGTALDDVLWRRVCRLPDDTRRLLEIIAVAGQPIRLRAAQDAAGVPSLPPEAVIALRAGQLVRGTGPGLDDEVQTFHDRIRETVVAHLPAATRAHRAISPR